MWRRRASLLTVLAGVGCSSEGETLSPPESCAPPNRIVAERCLAPGVQDDGCPAGTLGSEDGNCQPAGVPPELCAEGFVHDGDAACVPLLPPEPCPTGQMAVPGERACHPVVACGAGRWGDIPVDGASVYVDGAYAGVNSDGSMAAPWKTISEAIAAAPSDALVAVAAGNYVENVVVAKRLRLWGVCPDRVELAGSGTATLVIISGASGSEVRGFAVTGNGSSAIGVSGVEDVLIENVWAHDALGRGLSAEDTLGPTTVTLRNSLIESNHAAGAYVAGIEATIERVVVRDTLPQTGGQDLGYGAIIQNGLNTGAASVALVRSSIFERNHDIGVFVTDSHATLEGIVVRGTLPDLDHQGGRGIAFEENLASAPTTGRVQSSVVEQNHDLGLVIYGSEVDVEGVVVRATQPRASDEKYGWGIGVRCDPASGTPAKAVVRHSLIEQNHNLGVFVSGSDATLEGVVVRNTVPDQVDPRFGAGIYIQVEPDTGRTASALVRSSLVEQNHLFGVLVWGAQATLDALVVRDTKPRAADGLFGDDVIVATSMPTFPVPTVATMSRSRVEHAARAGLVNIGAEVTLEGDALACNLFDLDGEGTFAFENLGGNGCGCPDPTEACVAKGTGLTPPDVLPDSP